MKEYYKRQAQVHFKKYQKAVVEGDTVGIKYHKYEYETYLKASK